jgi:hypothetical protein
MDMEIPKLNWFLAILWVFGLLAGSVSQAGEATIKPENLPVYAPKFYPFEKGEKEVYRASWNGLISVATAEVTTTPTMVDGKKAYQVRIDAKTGKALDLIWKMRDTISSTFDAKSLSPSHYLFNQRENSRVIDTEAKLDATTKNWVVTRQQAGKKTRTYNFESQNTFDPVTAVYLARSVDFKVGDKLNFKIFGGRYHYLLELFVEKKEPVELPSGKTVEAYKIVPHVQNLKKTGYASRLREAAIWISADERRLPVKLSSKIMFGSVQLDLVEDKQGMRATAAKGERPAS